MLGRTAGSRNAWFVLFPSKFQYEKLTCGTNIGLGSCVPKSLDSEWDDPDPPRNMVYKLFLSRQVPSWRDISPTRRRGIPESLRLGGEDHQILSTPIGSE